MTLWERAEAWFRNWTRSASPRWPLVSDLVVEFAAVRAEARREALEEAAKEAHDYMVRLNKITIANAIEQAIRALKEKP